MSTKPSTSLSKDLHVRLTDADLERLERIRNAVQERLGPNVNASVRSALLEAFDAWDWREAERARKRK